MRRKGGNVVKGKEDVKKRWSENFEGLLNVLYDTEVDVMCLWQGGRKRDRVIMNGMANREEVIKALWKISVAKQ